MPLAVFPNEEQVFRLRLQITAFADLTLPEVFELLQAHRRENPDVSEIYEDRIIATRKKLYAELNRIGVPRTKADVPITSANGRFRPKQPFI